MPQEFQIDFHFHENPTASNRNAQNISIKLPTSCIKPKIEVELVSR